MPSGGYAVFIPGATVRATSMHAWRERLGSKAERIRTILDLRGGHFRDGEGDDRDPRQGNDGRFARAGPAPGVQGDSPRRGYWPRAAQRPRGRMGPHGPRARSRPRVSGGIEPRGDEPFGSASGDRAAERASRESQCYGGSLDHVGHGDDPRDDTGRVAAEGPQRLGALSAAAHVTGERRPRWSGARVRAG
jgi:hypothetical protein